MIYFPQTRIEFSVERPVVAGTQVNAEGAALVSLMSNGLFGVQQSTGTAADKFAGISVNMVTTPLTAPKIETFVVGAAKTVALSITPLPGTLLVVDTTTGTTITAGAAAAGTYQIVGSTISVDASLVGHSVKVAYRYSPTLVQAMALQGNIIPGGPAGQYLGQVGVITRGDVYTSEFDTSSDFSNAVGVTLGANGLFVATTVVANAVPNITILEAPSAARAYLGLTINAA